MAELQTLDLEWKPNKVSVSRYACVLAAAAEVFNDLREKGVADRDMNVVARAYSQSLFCAELAEKTRDIALEFDDMTLAELDLIMENIRLCVSKCPDYKKGYDARLAELQKSEGVPE